METLFERMARIDYGTPAHLNTMRYAEAHRSALFDKLGVLAHGAHRAGITRRAVSRRHCERSEAIQSRMPESSPRGQRRDIRGIWIASSLALLAMTNLFSRFFARHRLQMREHVLDMHDIAIFVMQIEQVHLVAQR